MMRWGERTRHRSHRTSLGTARVLGITILGLVALGACDEEPAPEANGATPDGRSSGVGNEDEEPSRAATGVTSEPCPDPIDETRGCIHLGSLPDRSDDRARETSDRLLEGQRDFWQRVNETGGIGGYEIHLADHVRDVTDDGDEQLEALDELGQQVLALALLPGDATSGRLVERLEEDGLVGVLPGWWSGWHADEYHDTLLLPADHSHCLAAVAGLDWYVQTVQQPASVLAVAHEGRVADDLAGAGEVWAGAVDAEAGAPEWLGVTETGAVDEGDDQDMAASEVLRHSPEVVLLGTGPRETGELVRKVAAQGFQGTFVGVAGTWAPHLLDDPEQAQALQALYHHVGPWDEVLDGADAHAAMAEARDGRTPVEPGYVVGWLASYPLRAALEAAAQAQQPSREGLREALDGLEVDHEGALPARTLGSTPATPHVVVSAPDAGTARGLRATDRGVAGPGLERLDHPDDCR